MLRKPHEELDILGANRHGQQLFLADMFIVRGARRAAPPVPAPNPPAIRPVTHEQLVLLPARRNLTAHGRRGLTLRADPATAARYDARIAEHGGRHGWNARVVEDTQIGVRILLGLQDTPGAAFKATDVAQLRGVDLPVRRVIDFLDAAGMLDDNREPAIENWFAGQIADLPDGMKDDLNTWFVIMRNGSSTPPRRKPRTNVTIMLCLRWSLPALRSWAAARHDSLREISRDDVAAALPTHGNERATTGQGLKSIFRILKARKVLFTDPTAKVRTGHTEAGQPLPIEPAVVRAGLDSTDLARAALVALIAFHALKSGQLRQLKLTDLHDGRLHLDGRAILLAEPVRHRVAAWLDHRQRRWPHTANAHLFIHYRTAVHTEAVGPRWIRLKVGPGVSPHAIRDDRILDEAHATAGDARRLSDLFGLSITATNRFTATLDHPDLIDHGDELTNRPDRK